MTRFVLTSAFCLALAMSQAEAFVSPSFVSSKNALPATYTPGSNLAMPSTTASRSSSSSALQMNLFDRFQRVAKSNINNVLKNLEDPEKIMTQALEDMQVSLARGFREKRISNRENLACRRN
jgi:phage shock protein A